MMSSTNDGENVPCNTLPPMICANQREKILPEEISADEIVKTRKGKPNTDVIGKSAPIKKPIPLHPLKITWFPKQLEFEIKEEEVVQRLLIWNSCVRSIYLHCCQLHGATVLLGASWDCSPRTRFLLAPGLTAELFVLASPRKASPVPCACAKLQLAAAHKRDHVNGYFAVPVNVKFLNHVPDFGEGG